VFASIKDVKLLVAFEAGDRIVVLDPLLLGAEGGLYYLTYFVVHLQQL
jgi:hypothetical protein